MGFPAGGSLQVAWSSPADSSTIPINSTSTLTGLTNIDADSVQVYLVYPGTPLGYATVVNGVWSIAFTPDLLQAKAYTLTAVASRSASTVQATRALTVTAVPLPGTWAANNGAWWDFRLLTDSPGANAPTVAPQEGTGSLVPANTPVVRVGRGTRKVIEFASASSQYMTAPSTALNGTRQPWTMVYRSVMTAGSARIGGFGNSANALDYIEASFNSGKVPQMIGRAGTAGGTIQTASLFAFDFDIPSLTTRTLVFTGDGTSTWLYVDGVADANNPLPFDLGAFGLTGDRFLIGARPVSTLAGYMSGQHQVVGIKRMLTTAAEALSIHNQLVASDQPAVVGTPVMFLGDSLTDGGSSGGMRKPVADFISANAYSITMVGPYSGGAFANNAHNGQGGNNMAAINTQQIQPYLGAGKAYLPKRVFLMTGTNDVDEVGMTAGTFITRYTTLLNQLDAAAFAGNAAFRAYVTTVPPYAGTANGGSDAAAAVVAAVNAGLIQGVWDTYDAANPTRPLIRWDCHNAIGGWSAGSYGTDTRHPLPGVNGYYKFDNAATYGFLVKAAIDFPTI